MQPPAPRLLTPWTLAGLALILALAVTLRLVLISHARPFVLSHDSEEFFTAGYSLVQTGEFPLPLKRAPLYALFLAGNVASFGPSLEAVAVVQHVLGLLTVVLVYLLGALAFGRLTGLLAALATAV